MLVNRATARHKRIKDKDQALRARMHELAEKRKRFGAPRLHVLLKQEGLVINHKRTERVYREEGLALRKSKPKKEIAKARKPAEIVGGPEECWAMDFVHDNLANGRSIRILSIVDLWDRSCPALTVGFSQTGQNVIRTLDLLKDKGHLPKRIRTDNGPEFTCNVVKAWAEKNGIAWNTTRKGKPTDNSHIESFNGRLRDECLNQHIFETMEDAREKIYAWRQDYNFERPHGALGWLTPAAYREKHFNQESGVNLKLV